MRCGCAAACTEGLPHCLRTPAYNFSMARGPLAIELGERLVGIAAGVEVGSHRPDLAGRADPRNPEKEVVTEPDIGAGHHAPTRPVPLLNQRLVDSAVSLHRTSVV